MSFLTSLPPTAEDTMAIVVTEVIGHNLCIASEDGEKVCDRITAAFNSGKKVMLSFRDTQEVTSAFLADAIGHLYALFPDEQIEENLTVVDIEPRDAADLKSTIHWVKEYLKDPQRFKSAAQEAFGEDYE
ncbi:hypothetical protein BCD67_03540 [Oscillatoriales cyanobacterium USR001]|nr:hypothetical protein BCD67_03540 [Oscillatoriales cyanobacterium USR001]